MGYMLRNLLELAIPGAILIGIFYAIFYFAKNGYKKLKGKYNVLTLEEKCDVFNVIKIFSATQLIGMLFFITPAINENIKIFVSLIATVGAFIATFIIKEKSRHNGVCRALIFIGQEFFGITMFLIMVNKGMGYTLNAILTIWTIFNFYISRTFKNRENKLLFFSTLLVLTCSLLINYIDSINGYALLVGVCVTLIAMQLFVNKENWLVKIFSDLMFTVLLISTFSVLDGSTNCPLIFGTILFYMSFAIVYTVLTRKINLRAFFIYIPYIVLLLIGDLQIELLYLLSIFNVIVSIWLLSDNSKYRKVICILGILTATFSSAVSLRIPDEPSTIIMLIASFILVLTFLLAPKKQLPAEVMEGGNNHEEQNY